jgi:hypothetical protein
VGKGKGVKMLGLILLTLNIFIICIILTDIANNKKQIKKLKQEIEQLENTLK